MTEWCKREERVTINRTKWSADTIAKRNNKQTRRGKTCRKQVHTRKAKKTDTEAGDARCECDCYDENDWLRCCFLASLLRCDGERGQLHISISHDKSHQTVMTAYLYELFPESRA